MGFKSQFTTATPFSLDIGLFPVEKGVGLNKKCPFEGIRYRNCFGTYLLAVCLARYGGDLSTAAAAYHSGIGQVDALLEDARYSSDGQTLFSFPYRQMNHYVNKVNASYQRYCSLYGEP